MPSTHKRVALVASVLLLFSSPVLNSQSQYSFDLDVPAARSSFWAIEDLTGVNRLSADLEIRELRRDSRWNPAFHFVLGTGNRTIGLRLVREMGDRDVTVSVVLTEDGKLTGQRTVDGWKLLEDQRFELTLDWSVPGTLTLSSNGTNRGNYAMDFSPQTLRISASTGQLFGHGVSLSGK